MTERIQPPRSPHSPQPLSTEDKPVASLSLLSLGERRAGEVRGFEGHTAEISQSHWDSPVQSPDTPSRFRTPDRRRSR